MTRWPSFIPTMLPPTLLAAAVMASPAPASAIAFKHSEAPFVAVHNCTCRLNGAEVPLHERRCLATAQGPRIMECVLEQNVTSWHPTGGECPQSLRFTPRSG